MNITRDFVILLAVLIGLPSPLAVRADDEKTEPLARAHAHNDYLHDRPLLDALEHGFCSVEADVFLVEGRLLVAHSFVELSKDRTLESLYLAPLRDRVQSNGGRVYQDGPGFTLLIDIKNNGAETYQALNKLLAAWPDVFSRFEDGEFHERAVTAIVSGDRAIDVIQGTRPRFAGIDGRMSDLDSEVSPHLMPLISDNWRNHFQWRGDGEFPPDERNKLKQIVRAAHDKQRRVRFWASPDRPAVWKVLNEAEVDLINTDDLQGLQEFLRSTSKATQGM